MKLFLSCLTVALLSGCATNTRVIDAGCDWAPLICISNRDVLTDGTARRILSYNLTREANCRGRRGPQVGSASNECKEAWGDQNVPTVE